MIRVYRAGCQAADNAGVDPADWALPEDAIWIDLVCPTREEDAVIETALGLSIPTREEMAELEASSRLYRENGATYVTADILHRGDDELPAVEPITFVLDCGTSRCWR